MSKTFYSVLLAFAALVAAVSAHAGTTAPPAPTTVPANVTNHGRNDNKLYVGINWDFGIRTGASALVGFRGAKVRDDGQVNGYKVEISYVLSGAPMGLGEARVKYLHGAHDAQGEIGAGYSFQAASPLLNLGVQGPFINGGMDYLFSNGGIMGYLGVNTLDSPKSPTQTLSCDTGFVLQGSDCVSSPTP
jgi:hypothetical protein